VQPRWLTALLIASVAVAGASLGYVAVTRERSADAIRNTVLRNLRSTGPADYESTLGGTTLVFPEMAWRNARAAGLDIAETIRRTGDNAWLVLDDVSRQMDLATIYLTSIYRATGTGPHTRGNALDIGYVQARGEPLVLLKRIGGDPMQEPALAREFRQWLERSPRVTQVLGPWWMYGGTRNRPNDMTSPLDVGHLTHVHITTRGNDVA